MSIGHFRIGTAWTSIICSLQCVCTFTKPSAATEAGASLEQGTSIPILVSFQTEILTLYRNLIQKAALWPQLQVSTSLKETLCSSVWNYFWDSVDFSVSYLHRNQNMYFQNEDIYIRIFFLNERYSKRK